MIQRLEALDAALSDLESLRRVQEEPHRLSVLHPDQLSFAAGEDAVGAWLRIETEFRDQVRELWRQLANCAYVESRSGGKLLACSRVSYASDTQTLWNVPLSHGSMESHQAELAHSLSARMRLMELIVLALRLFAGFSTAAANPLLAPLAISNAGRLVARLRALLTGGSAYEAKSSATTS